MPTAFEVAKDVTAKGGVSVLDICGDIPCLRFPFGGNVHLRDEFLFYFSWTSKEVYFGIHIFSEAVKCVAGFSGVDGEDGEEFEAKAKGGG